MLRRVMDYLAGKPLAARSPRWPEVEKAHLAKEPACQVCGGKQRLNVHHLRPFHLFPELELLDSNLVTLCNAKSCHITFGHCHDWKAWNENATADIARARDMILARRYAR